MGEGPHKMCKWPLHREHLDAVHFPPIVGSTSRFWMQGKLALRVLHTKNWHTAVVLHTYTRCLTPTSIYGHRTQDRSLYHTKKNMTIPPSRIQPTSDCAVASFLLRAFLRAPSAILRLVSSECRPPLFQGFLPLFAAEIFALLSSVCGLPPAAVRITVASAPSTDCFLRAPDGAEPDDDNDGDADVDAFTPTPTTSVGCSDTLLLVVVCRNRVSLSCCRCCCRWCSRAGPKWAAKHPPTPLLLLHLAQCAPLTADVLPTRSFHAW